MTAILPSGFMHYTTAVSRGMSDDPKMCSIMAKRAKNGGNNHQNGQFLHIPQFLPSENRIFWKNQQKSVA
jgi:hypothetical protein